MLKLNQVIAIEKGIKTKSQRVISDAHNSLKKKELFVGHTKTFSPYDEDGEQLPPDNMKVKYRVDDFINEAKQSWSELWDITAMRDYGNSSAVADVVVDNKVILEKVPVTYLLFLEKQLDDLYTFVKKLPILDSSEDWESDPKQDMFSTKPIESIKTKKVTRPLVLYEATDHHPAQVKEITEDVLHGKWKTIKYSTALQAKEVNEYINRVEKLQQAVKCAREKANEKEVDKKSIGDPVFKFVFDKPAH